MWNLANCVLTLPPAEEPKLPAWMLESMFWISIGILVALVVSTAGIWALVTHLRRVRDEAGRLVSLGDIDQKLARLVAARDDLDVRRMEHILIDIRDGHRRLEEAHLRISERGASPLSAERGSEALVAPGDAESLGERVVNRLLAMGFEQVQVITRAEKLSELNLQDGDVLVEAKRGGVLHKGRVSIRSRRLADVSMNPAYSIFP